MRAHRRQVWLALALVGVGVTLATPAVAGALTFTRTDYSLPTPGAFAAQPGAGGVALVDLRNNGKLDIVVADYGTGMVDVLLNNGDGTFAPASSFPACQGGQEAADIVAGQLNPQTDQNRDVAVICELYGPSIVRLLGDGSGSLGAPQLFGSQMAGGVVAVPPLRLGHLSGSPGGDYVFNYPQGSAPPDACFIPVTSDPSTGYPTCDSQTTSTGNYASAGTPVHFYDGLCNAGDLVVYFSGVGAYNAWGLDPRTGAPPGSGLTPCGSPFQKSTDRASGIPSSANGTDIAAADLNGAGPELDGDNHEPDVVMADNAGGFHVVAWQGTSSDFGGGIPPGAQPSNFASAGSISKLGVADFNGDGCPDIAAVETLPATLVGNDYVEHNLVAIHSGHCNTTQFDAAQTFDVAAGPNGYTQYARMAVGDLNGDGKPDIVTVSGYGPSAAATVLLNSASPSAATGPGPVGGPGAGSLPGGSLPGGGSGATTPKIAPVIGQASVKPTTFAIDPKAPSETAVFASAPKGTKFTYSLSEPARVVFKIERASAGRRMGRRCVRQMRANRRKRSCVRYLTVGAFAQQGVTGINIKPFSGRIGKGRLKPGPYVAVLIATNAAGKVSIPRQLAFRIVAH